MLAHEARERAVAKRDNGQPAADVLVGLVGKRRVEVGAVERLVEARPAEVVAGQLLEQARRLERLAQAHLHQLACELAVLGHRPSREDVERDALEAELAEQVAQVVVAAVRGQGALVDEPRGADTLALGRGQVAREIAHGRVVRIGEDERRRPVARGDLLEQLLRHGDQRGGALDRPALERKRVGGLRKAVLVGGPAQALHVVDVVDHRQAVAHVLERQHGQSIRQVVRVDDVGRERVDRLAERRARIRSEPPPGVEELVARAVPLAQRPALAGEPEGQVGARRAQADRVLERADARLLLHEQHPHRRLRITFAGFPTAIE